MKAKILLWIAAAFILVHLMGHGIGHSVWDEPEDPGMQEVVTPKVKRDYVTVTRRRVAED